MGDEQRAGPGPGRDPGLERLLFLTDGVFAIAMTLLAVELHLPEAAGEAHRGELLRRIGAAWPQVLAFAQSFGILALFWVAHHRLSRHLRRADGGLLGLTLAFLLAVSFLPVPTGVLGAHFLDPAALGFYNASLAVACAAFWAL